MWKRLRCNKTMAWKNDLAKVSSESLQTALFSILVLAVLHVYDMGLFFCLDPFICGVLLCVCIFHLKQILILTYWTVLISLSLLFSG